MTRRPDSPLKPSDQVFHAEPTSDAGGGEGRTLARELRGFLPELSWSEIRKQITGRRVLVNGNLCLDEARRIKPGDVLKVLAHAASAPPKDADVRVRFLDRHIVIVEKPAGMTTLRHPEERHWPGRRKQLQPTLDEVLPGLVEKLAARGQRQAKGVPRRLRAVHRLDRETSGLMVFARTIAAESALGKQFRAHELDRHYIGVCEGHFAGGTLESFLIEDRGDGRRGSTRHPGQGKRAVTHVTPLEQLPGYTVVQCRLETGRTHQIRIHLSEAGHPLCGDRVYRGPFPHPASSPKGIPDESGASRVALHAADLGLVHPITGAHLRYGMPLPQDLVELIDRLRGRSAPAPRLILDEVLDEERVDIIGGAGGGESAREETDAGPTGERDVERRPRVGPGGRAESSRGAAGRGRGTPAGGRPRSADGAGNADERSGGRTSRQGSGQQGAKRQRRGQSGAGQSGKGRSGGSKQSGGRGRRGRGSR